MSQGQFGRELNIKSELVRKYERVANRNCASYLWDISKILDMRINYFFDNMSRDTERSFPSCFSHGSKTLVGLGEQSRDPMARRYTYELVLTYYKIEKPIVRKRISEMVKSIATMLWGE